MLFQLTMFSIDKKGESSAKDVARVIDIIDKSGLPYKVSAMSTVIEGSWETVMKLINKARLSLRQNNNRIYISITIDDRKGATGRIYGKIKSLEKQLKREVKS